MHAGHLEAMAFLKADEHMDRYRRYDSHLQRAFDKALARVEKMASLRRPGAEPLPPLEPEVPRAKVKIKAALLRLPLPKNQPLKVLGEIFDHEEEEQLPSSS